MPNERNLRRRRIRNEYLCMSFCLLLICTPFYRNTDNHQEYCYIPGCKNLSKENCTHLCLQKGSFNYNMSSSYVLSINVLKICISQKHQMSDFHSIAPCIAITTDIAFFKNLSEAKITIHSLHLRDRKREITIAFRANDAKATL